MSSQTAFLIVVFVFIVSAALATLIRWLCRVFAVFDEDDGP